MVHPIITTEGFSFDKFKAEIALTEEEKKYEYLVTAYKGDYWQDGAKTLFPEISASGNLLQNLKSRYISANKIKECLERVSGAFLGQKPIIKFILDNEELSYEDLKLEVEIAENEAKTIAERSPEPTNQTNSSDTDPDVRENEPTTIDSEEEKTKRVDAAIAKLETDKDFSKKKKIVEAIEQLIKIINRLYIKEGYQKAAMKAFEASLLHQRGGIRVHPILKQLTTVDGENTNKAMSSAKSLTEAAKKIKAAYVEPGNGIYLEDNGEKLSIFLNKVRTNYNKKDLEEVIEYSYVDDNGKTIIATVQAGDDLTKANQSQGLALGESTTYYEIKGNHYITEQFFINNQLINLALTCAGFNVLENGFGEMVITNVEHETEIKYNPDTGKEEEVPKSTKRGGGVINNFVGITQQDSQGGEEIKDPRVYFKNPSPMTSFADAKNLAYENCLEEVGQLYAKITGDASASAISRVQALSDFYLKIKRFRPDVDCMLTWLLNVIVKFIIAIDDSKTLNELQDIEIIAQANIKVATLTIEEKQIVISMCDKGIISKDTARVLLEVNNYEQEKQKIIQEKIEADRLLKQLSPQLANSGNQQEDNQTVGGNGSGNKKPEPKADPVG